MTEASGLGRTVGPSSAAATTAATTPCMPTSQPADLQWVLVSQHHDAHTNGRSPLAVAPAHP